MNVYVLGAGVSNTVGYPLGWELLDEIDRFVRRTPNEYDNFDYQDWPALCKGLETNTNPIVREAYRLRHFEHLLTALDHHVIIGTDFINQMMHLRQEDPQRAERLGEAFNNFHKNTEEYRTWRRILLLALGAYFQIRHVDDLSTFAKGSWDDLKVFGEKLNKGDVVITFNYDASLERVLLKVKKWSPSNGYGFPVKFREFGGSQKQVRLKKSDITILHLHGATGWYKPPISSDDFQLGRTIALDRDFLSYLDFPYVDTSLVITPLDPEIIIHPSYMKLFELKGTSANALIELWRKAAAAVRTANKIFVLGYSLPQADSAAMTLLLTAPHPEKIEIVDKSMATTQRLSALLGRRGLAAPKSFKEWVKKGME